MNFGIPVLHVKGHGLPATWEQSMLQLLEHGAPAPSQYDKPGDPPTIDSTMVMDVIDPLAEPRIHKFFPGGPSDLMEYCLEVLQGVKDHWVRDPKNPEDKRWSYTYHGRICKDFGVNQLDQMVEKLKKQPFTRQAQFVTWMPESDPGDYDPPCLQRSWVRILRGLDKKLRMTAHICFRSRDAFGAAFMNAFAFIELFAKLVRDPVQKHLGEEIVFARYCDFSDSYHIYGKDQGDGLERFRSCVGKRAFVDPEEASQAGEDPQLAWGPMMEEAIPGILRKIEVQDQNRAAQEAGG